MPGPISAPRSHARSGVLIGIALACALHLAVSIVAIAIAGALGDVHGVFLFWLGIGALEWIYLYPALYWARRRARAGISRGILGCGIAVALLSLLPWLSQGWFMLPETLGGDTPANVEYSGNDAIVLDADAQHLTVRAGETRPDTAPETYAITAETRFDFRGSAWRAQARRAGMDWLTSGRRVQIDYVYRHRQRLARHVNIWVDAVE